MVDAAREQVWDVLVRPDLIAAFTPFVRRIDDRGDGTWRWELAGIPYPRGHFSAAFTERMDFDPHERITFTHEPAPGTTERAGVNGSYTLASAGDGREGTTLAIEVEISATLPVPRWGKDVVTAAMDAVIARMGDRFSRNLLKKLGAEEITR